MTSGRDPVPPPPVAAPLSGVAFRQRQRSKNLALIIVLVAMVTLFFAITVVQFSKYGLPAR
jgi:hypothetical protein